jgi:NhaP-type Na+/H+ or K+/H+ antiporter
VGPALAWVQLKISGRVTDVPTAIILQFISTFGVWMLADRLGLSGVLTVVSYAMTVARRAPELVPARIRIPSYAVWETVVFVLNVLAFVFIGLQMRPILATLEPALRTFYFSVAATILVAVILSRIAWVMTHNALARWRIRRHGFHPRRPTMPPTVGSGLIISWSGMRGIVSLAAALALPTHVEGAPFPFRDLIVLTAFVVVLGTLVIQGLTLKPLLRALGLHDDDPVGQEVERARQRALTAALATFDGDTSPAAEAVRQELADHLKQETADPQDGEARRSQHEDLHQRALAAARHTVFQMREEGDIGDTAFHRLEEEFDWVEMSNGASR